MFNLKDVNSVVCYKDLIQLNSEVIAQNYMFQLFTLDVFNYVANWHIVFLYLDIQSLYHVINCFGVSKDKCWP